LDSSSQSLGSENPAHDLPVSFVIPFSETLTTLKYCCVKYCEILCCFFNKICYSFSEVSEFILNKARKTFSFVAFFVVSTPETLV